MQNTHKIGILGLGTIATAVVEGIVSDGHDITVSTRGRANSTRLAGQYDNVRVAENQEVLDRSDIVFLGLTTDVARDTLGPLRFREGQQVITLMAELSLDATAALVAPARMTARMLPYPAIATGSGSPILHYGEHDLVESLFGSRNRVFTMNSEAELAVYLTSTLYVFTVRSRARRCPCSL